MSLTRYSIIRRWCLWLLVWLVIGWGSIVPVSTIHGAEPPEAKVNPSAPVDARQIGLIEAHILSRSDKMDEAMALFSRLRETYPEDRNIQAEYVVFLMDHEFFELAQQELTDLLTRQPSDLRAQRLQARLYQEQHQYGWTYPIYEAMVQSYGNDVGIWYDYAGARFSGGQWSTALANFCRVLELDPDNENARRMVHQIKKEHGPKMDLGHRHYEQIADGTNTDSSFFRWDSPVSTSTRLTVDVQHIDVFRSQQLFAPGVDGYFDDVRVGMERQINPKWSISGALGGYGGASSDTTFSLGGAYRPRSRMTMGADYHKNRPWYDPVDAIEMEGAFDRLRLFMDWNDGRRTGALLKGETLDYRLEGNDYGRQHTLLGILNHRFFENPELVAGYSYYRAWFDYEDDAYRPVAMVDDQGWHSIFGNFIHRPCTYWSWGLSGGFRRDHVRSLNAWYFHPLLTVHMGNRLEVNASYEYASESTTAVGGETQTWQLDARCYF